MRNTSCTIIIFARDLSASNLHFDFNYSKLKNEELISMT